MADDYESDWEDPNEDDETEGLEGDPPEDDEGEELNGYEEPDEDQEDLDAQQQEPQRQEPQRPQRKSFSQRVDERVEQRMREFQRQQEQQRAAPQAPPPPRETPEQFRARIANMDQVQFADYMLQQQQAVFNKIQFEAQESADKTAFDNLCRSEPAAMRLKGKVEAQLAEMRASGQTVARETIYQFLLGKMARENSVKATTRTRKTADANKQRQQARAPSGSSDTGRTTTDTTKSARDKRLENQSI